MPKTNSTQGKKKLWSDWDIDTNHTQTKAQLKEKKKRKNNHHQRQTTTLHRQLPNATLHRQLPNVKDVRANTPLAPSLPMTIHTELACC
jgi:hypothetical protein